MKGKGKEAPHHRTKEGAGDLPEDAQRSPMTRIAASGGGGGIAALSEQLIARRRAKTNG